MSLDKQKQDNIKCSKETVYIGIQKKRKKKKVGQKL